MQKILLPAAFMAVEGNNSSGSTLFEVIYEQESICSKIKMFLIFFFIKSYMHFCQSLKNITFLWFEDFPYFLLSDWLITCFIILTYKHSSHTYMYISIRCSTIQTTMGITGVILSWRRSAIYGQFVNVGTQRNKN